MRRPIVILVALALLAGCGSAGAASRGSDPLPRTRPLPRLAAGPTRVAILVLENHEIDQALGDMPYLRSLGRRHALATGYVAMRHPSLPNYVTLVTGTTAGLDSDCSPADCPVHARSIADQLARRRMSWRGYMEGLPRPCWDPRSAGTGRYAAKHDPFTYLTSVTSRRSQCRRIVPLTRLAHDERHGLPRFSFITPDLCHDAHDCSLSVADAFLRRLVPGVLRGLGRHGVLFVTFDEGTSDASCCGRSSGGGRVALVAAGPLARRGVRWAAPRDHRSTLATAEDLLGLPRLATTRSVKPLSGLLR